MSDLTKIATAEPTTITDGVSQQVGVSTSTPANSAAGLVVREVSADSGLVATSNPTTATNGSRTNIMTDKVGRQIVVMSHVRDLVVTAALDLTNTTETTLFTAAGSGVFLDLTQLVISSDSNTTTNVIIRDATGGAIRGTFALGRNTTGPNYNYVMHFSPPWPQTTANNNWTIQLSATVSTVHIFAIAVKNV